MNLFLFNIKYHNTVGLRSLSDDTVTNMHDVNVW